MKLRKSHIEDIVSGDGFYIGKGVDAPERGNNSCPPGRFR